MKILISDPISNQALICLEKNGFSIEYQPAISASEIKEKIRLFDCLIVRSRTKVTKEVIQNGINLRIIGRTGSGTDNIDISECKKRNITIVNAPQGNAEAVAEITLGLIIQLLRNIEKANSSMRDGAWLKSELVGNELKGKTVGILGYGFIGSRVAELIKPFYCKILVYSLNYKNCELVELFSKSDIITLHLTLNPETENLVNKKLLSKMKKNAYLINISRGEIINENDLYEILLNGKIAGAALDVYWQEPLPADSKWRKLPNVVLTPHIGAATRDAFEVASMSVANDLVNIKNGIEPKFKVI